ncbi:unnamed protein product, partial [Rotaria sordida]
MPDNAQDPAMMICYRECLSNLEKFNGIGEQKAVQFINNIERIGKMIDANNNILYCMCTAKLDGEAKRWYENNMALTQCENLKSAFLERFTTADASSRIFEQLKERKQKPDEIVTSYYDAIIKLGHEYDTNMSEKMMISWLENGIKDSLKIQIKRQMKSLPESARTTQTFLKIAKDEQELQKENIHEPEPTSAYMPYFTNTVSTTLRQEENIHTNAVGQPYSPQTTAPHESKIIHQQRTKFNETHRSQPRTRQSPSQQHLSTSRPQSSTFHRNTQQIKSKNVTATGSLNIKTRQTNTCSICQRNNHRTIDCYYKKAFGSGTRDGGDSSNKKINPSIINMIPSQSSTPIYINVQVNNKCQHAIIDTGSAVTIINQQLLKKIYHKKFIYKQKLHKSANCTSINIIGEIELEIKIQGHKTLILADVATNLITDLLVGNDWISNNNVIIDSPQRHIFLIDRYHRIVATAPFITPPDFQSPVLLVNEITLPPYSEKCIDVKIPSSMNNIAEALFEPTPNFHSKQMLLTNALLKVVNNKSRLTIINANDRQRTLSKNTKLGYVSHQPPVNKHLTLPVLSTKGVYEQFLTRNDLQQHLRQECYPQNIRDQIEQLTSHIKDLNHKQQLQQILWKHGKLFDLHQPSIIKATVQNAIETGNHPPIYTPPYRVSYKDEQIQRDEINKLLKQGIIEESTSPWSSPIVLVRKKDGTVRFCVDFRKLNNVTTKDAFPIPRIDDIFDHLSQAEYYTTIDFKSGYFQVGLDLKDRPKTAFSTRDQHYQFTVLPQGVTNGPPAFQRIVSQILGPTRWQHSLAYLDDVIIYSPTFDQHLIHLDDILNRLNDANFRLNVNKCHIAKTSIDYLGHRIEHGNIRPNAENIRALLETVQPTTAKEIFRFVKAAEYYRKFIPRFSIIAQSLHKYAPTTKEQRSQKSQSTPITLSDEELNAFNELKRILTNDL